MNGKHRVHRIVLVFTCLAAICRGVPVYGAEGREDASYRYNPQLFERSDRARWQKVAEVVEAIGLREGHSIADIGGGTGYFSRPFARAVGPRGVVYCCDIATNLLDYLQERAKAENLNNIVTVYAALDRPMLPPASVDFIFFCNTNHHLEDRVDYYKRLLPLLRPGGQLIVIDWTKKERDVGPPRGHVVAKTTVLEEMAAAGWQLVREEHFLDYQYFLVFQPKR